MSEQNDDQSVVATVNRDYKHYQDEEEINVLLTQEEVFELIESVVNFTNHKLTKIEPAKGGRIFFVFKKK